MKFKNNYLMIAWIITHILGIVDSFSRSTTPTGSRHRSHSHFATTGTGISDMDTAEFNFLNANIENEYNFVASDVVPADQVKETTRIHPIDFQRQVHICRVLSIIAIIALYFNYATIDRKFQSFYGWLVNVPFFRHFSFEPLLASTVFAINIAFFAIVDYFIPSLHKYRIQTTDSLLAWKNRLREGLSHEVLWYLGFWIPFGGIMRARRVSPTPISLALAGREVLLGLFIYDFLFFFGHKLLHKIPFLYRTIHAKHHLSSTVRAGDSVRHSFLDGTWDVICAVVALNTLRAHALSRSLFNIVAISLIVEAHGGMNLPWMLCNLIPFKLVAGPVAHDIHHRKGAHNFQKFFTYLDALFGARLVRV